MNDHQNWGWLKDQVREAAHQFGEQLVIITDTSIKVPNLDWSVAELGRHVAAIPYHFARQNQLGPDFEPPADWTSYSAEVRAHITTDNGGELAQLLADQAEQMLAADPDEIRYVYGRKTNSANNAATLLLECILHGQDLGRLTGIKPRLTRRQALAVLDQQMILTPVFIDPAKAARLKGTYGLRFRGGPDYTYTIDGDGNLVIEPGWPQKADARLNADPSAFIESSLGRANPIRVALTGGIVAYGRKPWRLAQLGNAVVDGV